MNPPTHTPLVTVDADHPWLGLAAFTEDTQRFFFGRDAEIAEIFVRVRDNTLTILYGQSGLGKSSLLGAGLLPKLRVEHYRPVPIRLRYDVTDPPLLDQVFAELEKSQLLGAHRPATLWEWLHHRENRPQDFDTRPPVLVFDQFEEIFTLGQRAERLEETRALFTQLAELIENRTPAALRARFQEDRRLARDYDNAPTPARLVITLREDFLSHLEKWKKILPSLMKNRMALDLLDGPQALEAVVRPGRMEGRNLVDEQVGAAIVRFVAKKDAHIPLEEIGAVPPLLSLVCDELNRLRLAQNLPTITAGLVETQSSDILNNFYHESFANLPDAVRHFIEDRLITEGGHRNPVAQEDALTAFRRAGVENPAAALDQLVARRLISPEERGGLLWIEITHDVLAPVVVRSRDERLERERAAEAERREKEEKEIQDLELKKAQEQLLRAKKELKQANELDKARKLAQKNFQSILRATDRLAVENIKALRWTIEVPTSHKRWLANQFDRSFELLLEDVGERNEIQLRHFELLIANSDLLSTSGESSAAATYAKRAVTFAFDEEGNPLESIVSRTAILAALEMARASHSSNEQTSCIFWLDRAHALLERSPEDPNSLESLILKARIADIRLVCLTVEMKHQIALNFTIETLAFLEPFRLTLAEKENLTEDEKTLYAIIVSLEVSQAESREHIGEISLTENAKIQLALKAELERVFPDPHDIRCVTKICRLSDPAIRAAVIQGDLIKAEELASDAIDLAYAALKIDPSSPLSRLNLAATLFSRLRINTTPSSRLQGIRDLENAETLLASIPHERRHPDIISMNARIAYQASKLRIQESIELHSETADTLKKYIAALQPNGDNSVSHKYLIPFLVSEHIIQLSKAERFQEVVDAGIFLAEFLNKTENHPLAREREPRLSFIFSSLFYSAIALPKIKDLPTQEKSLGRIENLVRSYGLKTPVPNFAEILSSLAEVQSHLQNFEKANSLFEQSLSLHKQALETSERSAVTAGNALYTYSQSIEMHISNHDLNKALATANEAIDVINRSNIEIKELLTFEPHWSAFKTQALSLAAEDKILGEHSEAQKSLFSSISAKLQLIEQQLQLLHQNLESEQKVEPVASALPDLQNFDLAVSASQADGEKIYVPEQSIAWVSSPPFLAPWKTLGYAEAAEFWDQLQAKKPFPNAQPLRVRQYLLPFYSDGQLFECEFRNITGLLEIASILTLANEHYFQLDGTSPPIHEANAIAPLRLKEATDVATYLRFFCAFVSSKHGSFRIIEHSTDIPFREFASSQTKRQIAYCIRPLVVWPSPAKEGVWNATATVHYATSIFWAAFEIEAKGMVSMLNDKTVASDLPIERPFLKSRIQRDDLSRSLELQYLGIKAHRIISASVKEAHTLQETRNTFVSKPSDDNSKSLVAALANSARGYLLDENFAEAETLCSEALDLLSKGSKPNLAASAAAALINSILAPTQLFQGNYNEALEIYRTNWNLSLEFRTFSQAVQLDFKTFETFGLTHPDLVRIRKELGINY